MVWTPNRVLAMVIGVVFLLIGILGFITNPTGGALLGIFDVDAVHNTIHLATGILGIAAALMGWSRLFNQVFGIIYLLVAIIGFIPGLNDINGLYLGIMHVNAADDILHIVVGAATAYVGFFVTDYARTTPTTPSI